MAELTDLPDETPVADAAEQERPALATGLDDEAAGTPSDGVPLESTASDWQEQQQVVDIDPEEDAAHD